MKKYTKPEIKIITIETEAMLAHSAPHGWWQDDHGYWHNPGGHRPPGPNRPHDFDEEDF